MSLRTFAILLLVFVSAGSVEAQIKITSAYYGRPKPEKTVDVTDTVQALVNVGRTSFNVAPGTFRLNPNPGRPNFLVVQYYAYGQSYTGRAEDGEIFSFRSRGPGYVGGTRIRFENGYPRVVHLYEVNRWGGWHWKAQLDPETNYSTEARAGENWVVTDRRGRVLQQVVVPRGGGTVRLR